ncbi:MAG: LLM class flavin-dependent oxidoreductase [Actinobacteria bacterium]|nr:LLM class flavin-dependent oxidoreductase [Actinomycetota bacterium]
MQYWFATSTEEFTPSQMLDQAKAADRAGFDGLGTSDHFAPWFPDGEGTQAWVYLGALGQVTQKQIGTAVTPIVHHYHPGLVAQAFMSLEELYPGRVFLGVGSGESVNETPLGMDWPPYEEQRRRLETGLEAITRLWNGETVTMDAGWFKLKDARLWTRAQTRPKLYISAFGPQSAAVAARFGDGLWTLGDPQKAPAIVEAYRAACDDHRRPPGEIIFQAGFAWADDDRAAIEGARHWKPTQLPELYVDDIADQHDMQRRADAQMSDEEFASEGFLISSDPDEHIERIREMERAGATVICLQLIGRADPFGSIRTYGERVLPALRSSAVGA